MDKQNRTKQPLRSFGAGNALPLPFEKADRMLRKDRIGRMINRWPIASRTMFDSIVRDERLAAWRGIMESPNTVKRLGALDEMPRKALLWMLDNSSVEGKQSLKPTARTARAFDLFTYSPILTELSAARGWDFDSSRRLIKSIVEADLQPAFASQKNLTVLSKLSPNARTAILSVAEVATKHGLGELFSDGVFSLLKSGRLDDWDQQSHEALFRAISARGARFFLKDDVITRLNSVNDNLRRALLTAALSAQDPGHAFTDSAIGFALKNPMRPETLAARLIIATGIRPRA